MLLDARPHTDDGGAAATGGVSASLSPRPATARPIASAATASSILTRDQLALVRAGRAHVIITMKPPRLFVALLMTAQVVSFSVFK